MSPKYRENNEHFSHTQKCQGRKELREAGREEGKDGGMVEGWEGEMEGDGKEKENKGGVKGQWD